LPCSAAAILNRSLASKGLSRLLLETDARPDGKGGYLIVMPHAILDRLKTMRGPGESYSDVIITMAEGG
jgi:hypothetical protein